jgi:hypothetical protein
MEEAAANPGGADLRRSGIKFVDANKRRFGLRDGGVGPVSRRQTYRAPPKPAS